MDQVRVALRAIPRDDWDAFASESGIPRSTVEKIAYGVTKNPAFDTMAGIIAALNRRSREAAPQARREEAA